MAAKKAPKPERDGEYHGDAPNVCTQCGWHVPSEGHAPSCDFHPDSLAHADNNDG